MNELDEKLNSIRKKIYLKDPFLGYVMQKISIYIISDEKLPTAATNGKDIFIGENFLKENPIDDLVFVIAHEILHIFLEHPKMMAKPNRNKEIFNIAADITVNGILVNEFDAPEKTNPIFGNKEYNHLIYSTEQIYEKLMKKNNINEIKNLVIANHNLWDDYQELEEEKLEEIYDYIEKNDIRFKYGSILERKTNLEISKIKPRKRDWKSILKNSISKNTKDFSYKRIDTRIENVLLPKFCDFNDSLENIWIMIDVSGSVSKGELEAIYNQIIDIISSFKDYEILVSFFSTEIYETHLAKKKSEIKKAFQNIKSTGGTSFDIIFSHIKKSQYNPKTLLIITDGLSREPRENPLPNTDVYWLKINDFRNEKFRFGKEINIKGDY